MKYALMNLLADAAATTATTDAAAATETMGTGATIVRIKDDVLTVEVGDQKTQMMIARWAVRNVEQLSVTNDSEQLI